MAKRKGKKRTVPPPKDATPDTAVEDSMARTQHLSPRRRRKGPRPSVEIVEIDSGEEERERQPRFRGVLRGLDPNVVIEATQVSVETADGDNIGVLECRQAVSHSTRQSRYGKSDANYDMKFHPMDVVTRPKRAAKRGCNSTLLDEDVETDEESLPSSARGSGASIESEDEDEHSSDEDDNPAPREPDLKATRHSKRAATLKTVNYSTKCHPQDYALPGRRHKARVSRQKQKASERTLSHVEIPATSTHDFVDLTSDADNSLRDDELADDEAVIPMRWKRLKPQTSSPRKKLRTLADERGQGSPYKVNLQSTVTETSSDIAHLLNVLTRTKTRGSPGAGSSTLVQMTDPTLYEHEPITSRGKPLTSVPISTQDSGRHLAVDDQEPRTDLDETEGDSCHDEEQSEELPSLNDIAVSGHDERFMCVNHSQSSDGLGGELRQTMFMNHPTTDIQEHHFRYASQDTSAQMPLNVSQRDMQHPTNNALDESSDSTEYCQQIEHQTLPSQFDEQFAVTESQENSFDDLIDALTSTAATHNVNGDDILRSLRSSQRTSMDTMLESDPTTAETDESYSEDQLLPLVTLTGFKRVVVESDELCSMQDVVATTSSNE